MFDEPYTEEYYRINSLKERVSDTDCVVVVGTTLETTWAMNFVTEAITNDIPVVEINLEPVLNFGLVYRLEGKCENVFKEVNAYL